MLPHAGISAAGVLTPATAWLMFARLDLANTISRVPVLWVCSRRSSLMGCTHLRFTGCSTQQLAHPVCLFRFSTSPVLTPRWLLYPSCAGEVQRHPLPLWQPLWQAPATASSAACTVCSARDSTRCCQRWQHWGRTGAACCSIDGGGQRGGARSNGVPS